MTRTIICLLTILLVMGIVGRYEYRYTQQDLERSHITIIDSDTGK